MASFPILREPYPEDLTWQTVDACERAAAAALLLLTAPLMLATAAAIRWLSGRTPFIAHRRVGWRGSALWILKLRTMWPGDHAAAGGRWIEFIDDESGPSLKQISDRRVAHPFARFCRRHSLDELPQLWHVVRGEMSLIGPRPVTVREIREHYGAAAEEVLRVKPGIAGLWQISGRNRLTYSERRRLDLEFVRNRSLRMYLRIVLWTMAEVCTGTNTW